jgi:GTPase SAR1 family protein
MSTTQSAPHKEVELQKFDMKQIPQDAVCVFIGRRHTGKTTLVRDLLFHTKKDGNEAVFHDVYDPLVLENYIKQRNVGGNSLTPFVVLDDCLYADSWTHNTHIHALFASGSLLLTMQYPLPIPKALKRTIRYVFLLREPFLTNRVRIFDNYGHAFPSFEVFSQIMDHYTNNYNCIVIDTSSKSTNLEDCIFWYNAEIHPT